MTILYRFVTVVDWPLRRAIMEVEHTPIHFPEISAFNTEVQVMRRTVKLKTIWFLTTFGVLLIWHALSRTLLRDIYLFEWASEDGRYLLVWIPVAVLILAGQYWVSSALAVGDLAGIVIGQLLGDGIAAWNSAKITPDMDAGAIYQLQTHYGAFILLAVLLIFLTAGIALQVRQRKKSFQYAIRGKAIYN